MKTKREAELEALARFAAAGKVKKLEPVKLKDPDEGYAPGELTYTLAEIKRGARAGLLPELPNGLKWPDTISRS